MKLLEGIRASLRSNATSLAPYPTYGTAATMHLGMMTNLKIVQEILGHSTIIITMDAYSHVLPPMHKEAMGNINEWLIAHAEVQEKGQVQHEEARDKQKHQGNSGDDGLSV